MGDQEYEKTMADVDAEDLPPYPSEEFERVMNSSVVPSETDKAVWAIMRREQEFEPDDTSNEQVAAVVVFKPGFPKDEAEWILARLSGIVDFATFDQYDKSKGGVPVMRVEEVK